MKMFHTIIQKFIESPPLNNIFSSWAYKSLQLPLIPSHSSDNLMPGEREGGKEGWKEKTNMNKHKLNMVQYCCGVLEKGRITLRREFTKEEAFEMS